MPPRTPTAARQPGGGPKPPMIDDKSVPVFTAKELTAFPGACKSADLGARRDHFILSLFVTPECGCPNRPLGQHDVDHNRRGELVTNFTAYRRIPGS
jgi:hypothetical protein